jgi:hypothetical protein
VITSLLFPFSFIFVSNPKIGSLSKTLA